MCAGFRTPAPNCPVWDGVFLRKWKAMDDPQITCIGTTGGARGGAAIAMQRLVDSLQLTGLQPRVVTLEGCDDPAIERTHARHGDTKRLARKVRRAIKRARSPLTNTMFTADWPAWDISRHPAVLSADIINVHWVAGFLNGDSIRRLALAGRAIVWTLHDERAFTGGCHYTAGCDGFTRRCEACPQLVGEAAYAAERVLRRSRSALQDIPLTFVSPSRWLAGELTRGALFNPHRHEVHVVPYDIDTSRFAPAGDRRSLRSQLALPPEGVGIVMGSVSLAERRKGARQAREAVELLRDELRRVGRPGPPPFLVTYGEEAVEVEGFVCRHFGPQEESGVIDILRACDVHLMMTREDNLPNTVMEALACGIPTVGTRVGGVPDMVEHGRHGWLVDRDDSRAAAACLASLVTHPEQLVTVGRAARQRCLELYAPGTQGARYRQIFSRLNHAAHRTVAGEPQGRARVLDVAAGAGHLLRSGIPLRPYARLLRPFLKSLTAGRSTFRPRSPP